MIVNHYCRVVLGVGQIFDADIVAILAVETELGRDPGQRDESG